MIIDGPVRVVAREGGAAPGLQLATFKSITALDGNGTTGFFTCDVVGNFVATKKVRVLYAALADGSVRLLAYKGQTIGNLAITALDTLIGSNGTLADERWRVGDDAIGVRLRFSNGTTGIYTVPATAEVPADWVRWVGTNDLLPNEALARAESFGLPAFTRHGAAVVGGIAGASKQEDTAILRTSPSLNFIIARENGAAPGEGSPSFSAFSDPVVSTGRTAFVAKTRRADGTTGTGLFYALFPSEPNSKFLYFLMQLAELGSETPAGGKWSRFVSLVLPEKPGQGPVFTAMSRRDRNRPRSWSYGVPVRWCDSSTSAKSCTSAERIAPSARSRPSHPHSVFPARAAARMTRATSTRSSRSRTAHGRSSRSSFQIRSVSAVLSAVQRNR
jgi:hypothetical protein